MIKVIKKEDVAKYLDDPKHDYVERHLREMRRHAKSLRIFIDERPQRAEFILSQIQDIKIELEASA